MADLLGVECAAQIGRNHETDFGRDSQMDLRSNQVGRNVWSRGENCESGCEKALENGELLLKPFQRPFQDFPLGPRDPPIGGILELVGGKGC